MTFAFTRGRKSRVLKSDNNNQLPLKHTPQQTAPAAAGVVAETTVVYQPMLEQTLQTELQRDLTLRDGA
jgi:hypothetical protein